jgi:hypothetical protein
MPRRSGHLHAAAVVAQCAFAWPVKPRALTRAADPEAGRSHSSRSSVAARQTIDPELLRRVETDPSEALWTSRSMGPTRALVPP